jgi:uncharacterized membrane protein YbhN (UPF0104 family)
MSPILRKFLAALLVAVALYGLFVVYVGYQDIQHSLHQLDVSAVWIALGLATCNYLIRFLKWEFYLARLGIRDVGKLDSLLIFLSGFVLTITPGKLGEVFKSAVLQRTHGVPLERTAPIVVAERLTDAIGVIVLILIGSLGFSGGFAWAIAGLVVVTFGMVCIIWPWPLQTLFKTLENTPLQRWVPRLHTALRSLRVLASPVALIWPTLLSIVAWGAEGYALQVLLLGFGANIGLMLPLFFYATATLAGALIPVPGGLGVTEGMIQNQLVQLGGISAAVATSSMILVRLATLWWAVLVGFLALGWIRARFPNLTLEGNDLARAPTNP